VHTKAHPFAVRSVVIAAAIVLTVACGDRLTSAPPEQGSPQTTTPTGSPNPPSGPPDVIVSTPSPMPAPTTKPSDLFARARGDFDCDGNSDDFALFVQKGPTASANVTWLARLTLATGPSYELTFVAIPSPDQQIVGIADVNGDGCSDAVVDVGHGASTTWVEFFVFDGVDLREIREIDRPFVFSGSVRHGDGIECRATDGNPEIVHRSVSNYTSDFQWDLFERVYRWTGKADLVLASTRTIVIPVVHAQDQPPDLWRYWGLSCGALRAPAWVFARH
jgi:hypothetical protein